MNVYASQNSCVEILTSGVIALGGEVFGQKSGALMNGVSALFIKEIFQSFLVPSTTRGLFGESALHSPEEGSHPEPDRVGWHPDLGPPTPQNCEK